MFSRRLGRLFTTATGKLQLGHSINHQRIPSVARNGDYSSNRLLSTTPRMFVAAATTAPGSSPFVLKGRGVGGIKGALYGFLVGCTLTGAASYYYFLEEYKVANELLTEDVDALRASVLRIEQYVRGVEDKLADGSVVVKK